MANRALYRSVAKDVAATLAKADVCTDSVAELARRIAQTFKLDRAEFRYDKFFDACGLDSFGYVKGTVHK